MKKYNLLVLAIVVFNSIALAGTIHISGFTVFSDGESGTQTSMVRYKDINTDTVVGNTALDVNGNYSIDLNIDYVGIDDTVINYRTQVFGNNIIVGSDLVKSIGIYNSQGQFVKKASFNVKNGFTQGSFETSGLSSGLYFVNIVTSEGNMTLKTNIFEGQTSNSPIIPDYKVSKKSKSLLHDFEVLILPPSGEYKNYLDTLSFTIPENGSESWETPIHVLQYNESSSYINGLIQKGPFITGSNIEIQELNENLSPNGNTFNVSTEDNFGSFTLESEIGTDFIEIISQGFYFNEVTGMNTDTELTLRALSNVSDSLKCNINILTTLTKKRIVYLINDESKTYNEAKQQAQNEILDIFSIHETEVDDFEKMDISQNRISDAILLAISAVLQGSNSVSELSLLISTIIEDIKEDGILDDIDANNEIYNNAKNLNLVDVRNNIETRYADLGLTLTVPDFEKYVNDMWKKQCTIISPLNNQTFNYNDSMTVNIDDFASFINIVNTKYYLDGQMIFDDNDYPFINNYKLMDLVFGDHLLKAVATDDSSNAYVDSINIIVNTPDQFTLVSPSENILYTYNDSIHLNITDQPDYINVTNVQYYHDEQEIANISESPFDFTYIINDSIKVGKIYVKASITDELGRTNIDSVLVYVAGMSLIPSGTYQMGDNFNEGNSNELPVHSVTLSDYYMGVFELTQYEWRQYKSNFRFINGTTNLDAELVGWYEIIKYCNFRSIDEGYTPCYTINSSTNPVDWGNMGPDWDAVICDWNANGYRLPTEAEWEYAARGGMSGQRFPNGLTISHSTNGDTQAGYYSTGTYAYDVSPTSGNHPLQDEAIGKFPPNDYGLYDMAGNWAEWCWDWYSSSYYNDCDTQGVVSNPKGSDSGSSRVVRNGYSGDNAFKSRNTFRDSWEPIFSGGPIGFRLARTP